LFTVYQGESEFGEGSVVGLLKERSTNKKTGDIPSVTFLPDIEKKPSACLRDGDDKLVCGECPLRKSICYVATAYAPNQMYKSFKAGKYEEVPEEVKNKFKQRFKVVRLGQYGDCACMPKRELAKLFRWLPEVINYTHSWRGRKYLNKFAMASVQSPSEREAAKKLGFRTFRIKRKEDPILPGEILCPGDFYQKNPIQCGKCRLCVVTRKAKDIAVNIHGPKGKVNSFYRLLEKEGTKHGDEREDKSQ